MLLATRLMFGGEWTEIGDMRTRRALALTGLAIVAAGCASATTSQPVPAGTVQGTFLDYPGPMPASGKPSTDPRSGKATFTENSGHAVWVTVPDTGKFIVRLAAGTYTGLLAPTDLDPVRLKIRVRAGQTLKITILCSWDSGSCGLAS